MILVVKIQAPKGAPLRTLRFSKSPIRMGRNQLNDIPLDDPFVSEWHGTIRFDDQSVAYFDLGSTNGTLLEGKRLPKNVATPLTETSRLKLGLLEVSVVTELEVEAEAPRAPKRSDLHQTLAWGNVNRGAPSGAMPGTPATTPSSGSSGMPGMSARGGDSASSITPPPRPAEPAGTAQQAKLLEAFVEAFIGLRKGYEQFGAEVGVRTINGNTPLHRARSQRELLDYLMQPKLDAAALSKDIIAIFADFGIHHIAMMQGVTEGVRQLLQSLSPQAHDIDTKGGLFGGGKAKGQWKAYVEHFEQLLGDDNELHSAIFGNEFARAYASVTMGDGGAPADPGQGLGHGHGHGKDKKKK
jgi:predicted component of type VI protein secretion system